MGEQHLDYGYLTLYAMIAMFMLSVVAALLPDLWIAWMISAFALCAVVAVRIVRIAQRSAASNVKL